MIIPEIKKILYATDLSENALNAFAYAASLSHRYDAKITILHVLEELPASVQMQVKSYLGEKKWLESQEQISQEVAETVKKRLEKFCSQMGVKLEACPFILDDIVVVAGPAVNTILEESVARGCDIVVLGTHGFGLFKDAVMGSTARRVLRRCPIPVLTVRLPK